LRELQGLSYASIAKAMGISEPAVETLLHRARKRFREEFLRLESPPEEQGPCAKVAYYVETIGRARLSLEQSQFVAGHLESCDWCRGIYARVEAQVDGDRQGSPQRRAEVS
ncbi:MAG TPA: sigma factor-like helix-turn-helix DNA-binding protein, partial [Candidatus Sulfotelmatobacter sp.]|nr:sigma factor-like helix-turn-helix DNA-binding protein [Candidatus Sulfotelmatobacter sp.]